MRSIEFSLQWMILSKITKKWACIRFELNNVSHSAGALGTNIETDTLPKKEGGSISQYRTRKQAYQNNYNLSGKNLPTPSSAARTVHLNLYPVVPCQALLNINS